MDTRDNLSFKEFNTRFKKAALERGAKVRTLANGCCVAVFRPRKKFRLAVMAGLHGDERSGPMALLDWIENAEIKSDHGLWIAPLINDFGWDNQRRRWHMIDLNRHFEKESAPKFINQTMRSIKKFDPTVFLDLHEDVTSYPYIFKREDDGEDSFLSQLQTKLKVEYEPWKYFSEWNGSSENYARLLGCKVATTIEAPNRWPLDRRIDYHISAVKWCYRQIDRAVIT